MNFDEYADKYKKLCDNLLGFFESKHDYFLRRKIELAAKATGPCPAKVLDFGSGIGEALPAMKDYFPQAKIFAYDPSEKSLEIAKRNAPWVHTLNEATLADHRYDCIIVSCVLHHIPPAEWATVTDQLARLLAPQGWLCVFEHNPWNPVTRWIVRSCPFDADAVLLSKSSTTRLLASSNLKVHRTKYYLFFPNILAWFRKFEQHLSWLPLGGQYFVGARLENSTETPSL